MSDWTVIASAAIAASAAILGAALGYATARRQADVELHKAEAETERLLIVHGEEHLRHRQAVYHDFLDSAHRFHQSNSIEPWESPDALATWSREFEHRLVAVSLFGTDAARAGANRLADAVYRAIDDIEYDGPIEDEFLASWAACIEAMRPDTSPD